MSNQITSLAQFLARALVHSYPLTKHYWTLFTLVSFSYFLGTSLKDAHSLSIINSLLWGNSLILWTGFLLESLIRHLGLAIDYKIKSNPNSNWIYFNDAMPYLLNYCCGAGFCIATAAVLSTGEKVAPVDSELIASIVLGVFYMVMAFGKSFDYSPSISLSSAFLGLMMLRKGVFGVACIFLFCTVHIVYPELSRDVGPCLRNFGEHGRWEIPVSGKKVEKAEVGVRGKSSFVGLLFDPVASKYQLLVLERVQIFLIVCASVAAVGTVFLESRISHSAAGWVYDRIGAFLELVNLKHVSYK